MARLPGFKGEVEFRFDEVISEGSTPSQGAGTGDLEKLVILSPTTRVPHVNWRRNRITVSPAEGWRPDRVYRVELLPGVSDLRRNPSKRGTVLTFTTGAELPTATVEGTVVDWTTGRPAPAALVEALLFPDSLPYRGIADSSGHFALGPLPTGEYLVRGTIDQNRNAAADPREPFDTVRLASGKTAAGELWTFVHDTTPPRIQEIAVADSVSAMVSLSQTLDPRQRLRLDAVTVRSLPDSTPVRVISLLTKPEDDSLHRPAGAEPDSAADTTRKQRPGIREVPEAPPGRAGGVRVQPRAQAQLQPLTTRPPLTDKLVVRVERPWTAGGKYAVEIRGVRNTTGAAGDVRGAFTAPKPPAPGDSTRVKGGRPVPADSTRVPARRPGAPGDSAARRSPKPKP
jgi:hypothetical protein